MGLHKTILDLNKHVDALETRQTALMANPSVHADQAPPHRLPDGQDMLVIIPTTSTDKRFQGDAIGIPLQDAYLCNSGHVLVTEGGTATIHPNCMIDSQCIHDQRKSSNKFKHVAVSAAILTVEVSLPVQ